MAVYLAPTVQQKTTGSPSTTKAPYTAEIEAIELSGSVSFEVPPQEFSAVIPTDRQTGLQASSKGPYLNPSPIETELAGEIAYVRPPQLFDASIPYVNETGLKTKTKGPYVGSPITETPPAETPVVSNPQIESFSRSVASSAKREAKTAFREIASHASPSVSIANRGEFNLDSTVLSFSESVRSSARSDRTTLELQNQILTWDPDNAEWYTEWFQQPKIVDSEDTLSVRSLVSDYVEQTEATVRVEYDADGNGTADKESKLVELGSEQKVKEVEGLPIDENGFYRIKVTEYSGYYSIYGLNLAVTH